ncbi:MAG: septal ring lytic transglycosylase RlpA family protein [Candidatus Binatia bacterium]
MGELEGSVGHPLRKFRLLGGWGLLLVLFVTSCAGPRIRPQVEGEEVGIASWYGPKFHGRRTSSGEVFDMHQLTAAHRALPLGTRVEVINLENGRSIQVRVNDRGPFVAGRIIDLSYAAARALDMVERGLAQVRIRPLHVPGLRLVRGPRPYALQVGSFLEKRNAITLKARLDALTAGAYISTVSLSGETFYRVRVGGFHRREAAEQVARQVAAHGFTVILMEEE